jgi:hypothetical protein
MSDQEFLLYPLDTGEDPVCLGCGSQMTVAGHESATPSPTSSLSDAQIAEDRRSFSWKHRDGSPKEFRKPPAEVCCSTLLLGLDSRVREVVSSRAGNRRIAQIKNRSKVTIFLKLCRQWLVALGGGGLMHSCRRQRKFAIRATARSRTAPPLPLFA